MSLASTIRAAAPHTPQSVAQAFNSRSNSIGFLRWLMAFMVIFSHAGPIAYTPSERAASEILSLPMFGHITAEQQERVAASVISALGRL